MPRLQGPPFRAQCRAADRLLSRVSGGRTWWAHFEFTRINITPTIRCKKIEDVREALGWALGTISSTWFADSCVMRPTDSDHIRGL
jgi:hypothetical protein